MLYINIAAFAQTNPAAFDMKGGNYKFDRWDSTAQSGTYPHNMIFQWLSQPEYSSYSTEGSSDYNCEYYTAIPGARIGGLGNNGFCFYGSSESQFEDCNSSQANNRFVGCAVLSLNTTNRKDLNVYWKGGTDKNANTIPMKECRVRLQYRIGSSRNFRDVKGNIEYVSSTNFSDSLEIGPVPLDHDCDNQKLVQLRWIYYEPSKKSTGLRPQMRVDDIYVTSAELSSNVINVVRNDTNIVNISNEILTIDLNNYYNKDKYEITIFTPAGKNIYSAFNNEQFLRINVAKLIKGPCIISMRNTKTDLTIYKKLFIQ